MLPAPCRWGCIFFCPCDPDKDGGGCNGCEIPMYKWKLLGDCRMPESEECEMNRRDRENDH